MPRVWSSTLATACATVALVVGGCGDGDRTDPGAAGLGGGGIPHVGGGAGTDVSGAAGESAGEGQGAVGGTRGGTGGTSRGGSGGTSRGGSDTGSGGDDRGGTGGTHALGGTAGTVTGNGGAAAEAGEGGLGGTGNGGTGGKPIPEQLDVCVRQQTSPSVLAWDVSRDFEFAVNSDCRVGWVRYLYLDPANSLDERVEFLNQLIHFGLDVWGCVGASPPQSFDLVWQPTPLSAADVEVLIDHYIEAATEPLTLSPGEIADMRALLGKLAEPLLMQPDPGDFSDSRCDDPGSGGESGAGGHAGSG